MGYSNKFFEKHYLNSGINANKDLIVKKYNGPLKEPKKHKLFFWFYKI